MFKLLAIAALIYPFVRARHKRRNAARPDAGSASLLRRFDPGGMAELLLLGPLMVRAFFAGLALCLGGIAFGAVGCFLMIDAISASEFSGGMAVVALSVGAVWLGWKLIRRSLRMLRQDKEKNHTPTSPILSHHTPPTHAQPFPIAAGKPQPPVKPRRKAEKQFESL